MINPLFAALAGSLSSGGSAPSLPDKSDVVAGWFLHGVFALLVVICSL